MATRRRRRKNTDDELAAAIAGITAVAQAAKRAGFADPQSHDAGDRWRCACGWLMPRRLSIEGLTPLVPLRVVVECPGCGFTHHVRFKDATPTEAQKGAENE